jgi:hypothetical protein
MRCEANDGEMCCIGREGRMRPTGLECDLNDKSPTYLTCNYPLKSCTKDTICQGPNSEYKGLTCVNHSCACVKSGHLCAEDTLCVHMHPWPSTFSSNSMASAGIPTSSVATPPKLV